MKLTGHQRLRQIRVKCGIRARRELRAFMAGEIPWLPCRGDAEREAICAEFDRVYAMGYAAGRSTLTASPSEGGDL